MDVREKRGRLPAFTAVAAIVAAAMMLPATMGTATTDLLLQGVDIGDVASEDLLVDMEGWGPVVSDTGDNWGGLGDGDCRVVWCANDENWATVTFAMPEGFTGSIQYLNMRVLDGQADDSFEVYLYDPQYDSWARVYEYTADTLTDPDGASEQWIVHTVYFVDLDTGLCATHGCCWYGDGVIVKIVATGDAWGGFETYGQLGVDWIDLIGSGKQR
ncbi:MAG: hypothetical protein MUE55_02480 [Thermoplasmata archaeon]|nr:hypothetical protein [Thermoplasmata archaeon]